MEELDVLIEIKEKNMEELDVLMEGLDVLIGISVSLNRIATALEQKSNGDSVRNIPVKVEVDAEKLAKELIKRYPNFQQSSQQPQPLSS